MAFTRGFSPRPKVSFGPALAVGYESDAEYLDVECVHEVEVDHVTRAVNGALPDGMAVTGIAALAARAPALQEVITSLAYRVARDPVAAEILSGAVDALLARRELSIEVTRKGERAIEDIRPSVLSLAAVAGDAPTLELEVATRPRTLRVADVVAGLQALQDEHATTGASVSGAGIPGRSERLMVLVEHRVVRTHQWIERGGARQEPLDVDRRSPAPEGAVRALEACA